MRRSYRPIAAKAVKSKQWVIQRRLERSQLRKGRKLPVGYPRRIVHVDLYMLRQHPAAICARATLDVVVVLRCGKPAFAVVHFAYYRDYLDMRSVMEKRLSVRGRH